MFWVIKRPSFDFLVMAIFKCGIDVYKAFTARIVCCYVKIILTLKYFLLRRFAEWIMCRLWGGEKSVKTKLKASLPYAAFPGTNSALSGWGLYQLTASKNPLNFFRSFLKGNAGTCDECLPG